MKTHAEKNKRSLIIMSFVVIAMFGFGYALVPLYNVLCKAIGINGKTGGRVVYSSHTKIDKNRDVVVEFLSTNNALIPWEFRAVQKKVKLHPGELTKVAYYAKNNSDHAMTIQAIPSVTPSQAAKYLKKTECFCFTRQTLQAGEEKALPMIFHIDPALPKKYNTVSISYTIFDVSKFKVKKNKNAGRIT